MAEAENLNGTDPPPSPSNRILTERERDRVAKNKEKARALRASRVVRPYPATGSSKITNEKLDTGGGFLLEEDEEHEVSSCKIAREPPLVLGDEQPTCKECVCSFAESYLLTHFRYPVCDNCRQPDGTHSMIARTAAKEEFILKDCDLDERPGPLPFILRRNPHARFSDMKLYLKCQVEERAISIWDSMEALEAERASRETARTNRKQKKLDNDLKVLRKSVLSKTKDRGPHQHQFLPDAEVYNEDDDTWTKTCTTCGYSVTFEKM